VSKTNLSPGWGIVRIGAAHKVNFLVVLVVVTVAAAVAAAAGVILG
jgi:hypothetical protein